MKTDDEVEVAELDLARRIDECIQGWHVDVGHEFDVPHWQHIVTTSLVHVAASNLYKLSMPEEIFEQYIDYMKGDIRAIHDEIAEGMNESRFVVH